MSKENEKGVVVVADPKLPKESIFCGYVVHLPGKDEFLAMLHNAEELAAQTLFCKSAASARIYQEHHKAISEAERCEDDTIVCLLFDIGSHFVAVPINDPESP